MSNFSRYSLFVLLTPIFYLLAQWISVFPHEFAHSLAAWILGFKDNPMEIYYGHFNWQNIIFVSGIDENVNYKIMYPAAIGWVGLAGPFVTLLMYLTTFFILRMKNLKNHSYGFYFIFWINAMNLSELLSYVILRSFSGHGDIAHIELGFGISPWTIFLVGGTLLVIALWYFYRYTMTALYTNMQLQNHYIKVYILACVSLIFFAWSGIRMLLDPYGIFATLLGIVFLMLIPIIMIACWPSREWISD